MFDTRRWLWLVAVLGLAMAASLMLMPGADRADAQCGTQASSCKNCHEVQGQYPVNAEGQWHVDHAAQDLCVFCHAGNPQATDAEAAHQGLVSWNEDVRAGCYTCHEDYLDKANVYASILGVEVMEGGQAAPPPGGEEPAQEEPSQPVETEEASEPVEAEEAPPAGEVIDYNAIYEESARTIEPLKLADVILAIVAVGMAAVGAVLVWQWEGLGQKLLGGVLEIMRPRQVTPRPWELTPVEVEPLPEAVEEAFSDSPELLELLPYLRKADAETLRALRKLLADPDWGGPLIQGLAKFDPRLIEAVRRLPADDRELLVALLRNV